MSNEHRWGGERNMVDSWVVSSPRRLLSLSKSKGRAHFSISDSEEKRASGFEHGTKPSEVYGFVGSISTVVATAIFLAWAYTPEPWLQYVGITYYPSRLNFMIFTRFACFQILGIGSADLCHGHHSFGNGILSWFEFRDNASAIFFKHNL